LTGARLWKAQIRTVAEPTRDKQGRIISFFPSGGAMEKKGGKEEEIFTQIKVYGWMTVLFVRP
jgi:chemotaxis receptor (MCP) glutamine deamidase CheD